MRVVATGEALLAPTVTRRLISEFTRLRPRAAIRPATALDALTPRETEVLKLVAEGLSNPEIAARLVVTDETVKTHVSRILNKLGLRDRTQAVVTAYESGLVVPGSGAGVAAQRLKLRRDERRVDHPPGQEQQRAGQDRVDDQDLRAGAGGERQRLGQQAEPVRREREPEHAARVGQHVPGDVGAAAEQHRQRDQPQAVTEPHFPGRDRDPDQVSGVAAGQVQRR